MPIAPLRPWSPEETSSRTAFKLTDAELSPEAQQATMEAGFGALSEYLIQNEFSLQNILNHRSKGKQNTRRIISEVGFRELGQVGLPATGSVPTFQYIPAKAGQILDRDKDPLPFVFLIHSFGGGFDRGKLTTRNVRSVAVDKDTGFNPARFYNGINTLVKPGEKKSIHHLISRRGDLVNSAPWDMVAFHGGGPGNELLKNAVKSVNWVSIGIELEEYFVRHTDEKTLNPVINRVPYTDQQYAVIAFLLKKYITWSGNTDILRWLGPPAEAIASIRLKQAGCSIHRVFHPEHGDPSAEFMFPPGFVKGDPIPSYLHTDEKGNDTKRLYERRIELFWGDVPTGTPLSAWDAIFEKVPKIRNFKLNTEVFDLQYINPRIPLETPTITGTHMAALANTAGRDQLSQVVRSQSLQLQTRAELYGKAREMSETGRTNMENTSAKLTQVNKRQVAPATILNAPGFDFATGQIVYSDAKSKV